MPMAVAWVLGIVQLERQFNCAAEHLEIHIWYLIENALYSARKMVYCLSLRMGLTR